MKTCEYLILTKKENCQMDKLWKIWKETAFIELCSFFIDLLGIRTRQVMPGGGDFCFIFFDPGGQSFALKSCPRGGGFWRKN